MPFASAKLSTVGRSLAKKLLRDSYELSIFAVARQRHLLLVRQREARKTREICLELKLQELTLARLREILPSSSGTCFILGSGESINDLTEEDFDIIRRGVSIGINAWVSHPFTADAYSFEADGLDEDPSPEIEAMSRALDEKARENPELAVLLLRPKQASLQKRMTKVPPSLGGRTLMYGRHNMTTRKPSNLRKDLSWLVHREERSPLSVPVVVDNGATVARLLSLTVIAGFSRVVLLGVDLNTAKYFWEDNSLSPTHSELVAHYPRGHRAHHDTLDTDNRPFSTPTFLVTLAQSLKSVWGTEIMVGSHKSALAAFLPVYEWRARK